jgi:hypoxanthine phosphoribosyltransferase
MPDSGIARILVPEDEIARTVRRLGAEITEYYKDIDGDLVVVGLLRGSFVFMADLIRVIKRPLVVDFMAVST